MAILKIINASGVELMAVPIDDKDNCFNKSGDQVTAMFYYDSLVKIQIWDYLEYAGENYYLKAWPEVLKVNNNSYKYNLQLTTTPTNKRGKFNQ